MPIVSVEPTPNPNSLKLIMNESIEGVKDFKPAQKDEYPESIQKLLSIEGVEGVFQAQNFITIRKNAETPWESILEQAKLILGNAAEPEHQ